MDSGKMPARLRLMCRHKSAEPWRIGRFQRLEDAMYNRRPKQLNRVVRF